MSWLSNFLKKKKNIQIEGTYEKTYSLSIVNTTTALALNKYTKHNIKVDATKYHRDYMLQHKDVDKSILDLTNKTYKNIDVTIRNIYPPHTDEMNSKEKIFGPYGWEESKIPSEFVSWFNKDLTQVFAMSNYVKKVLLNNGVKVPITVTGIVVEDLLHIKSQSFDFDLPTGYSLLHISSSFPRKGIDQLIQSFESLDFIKKPLLIIKTFPNPHNEVKKLLVSYGFNCSNVYEDEVQLYTKKDKKVLLINKDISKEKIKYLYEKSNILVCPTKGEGFGLPMAEAMLMNLPVVTTKYGGQSDFCKENNSWLCDFNFEYTSTHMNQKNSVWQVARVESIYKQIKQIYTSDSIKLKKKTKRAKDYILENYSAKKVAQNIENAIDKKIKKQKSSLYFYLKDDKLKIDSNVKKIKTFEQLNLSKHEKNITHLVILFEVKVFSIEELEKIIYFSKNNNIYTFLFFKDTNEVLNTSNCTFLKKVDQIYVTNLEQLNYLKSLDIYKNTTIFESKIENLNDFFESFDSFK